MLKYKILKWIIILVPIFAYIIFSFVMLDLNFASWKIEQRSGFVFCSVFLTLAAVAIWGISIDDIDAFEKKRKIND